MARLISIGEAAKLAGVSVETLVLEIITVFSSRLYGSRSRKNLKIMQKLHEIPQEISPQ